MRLDERERTTNDARREIEEEKMKSENEIKRVCLRARRLYRDREIVIPKIFQEDGENRGNRVGLDKLKKPTGSSTKLFTS